MLHLPTNLTIKHLFDNERKIIISSKHSNIKPFNSINSKNTLNQLPCYPIDQQQQQQSKQMLKMLIPQSGPFYQQFFCRTFCLIKLNSLLSQHCTINKQFLIGFTQLYNKKTPLHIIQSKTQQQFFSQVILQGQLYKYIKISDIQNILNGQCLLATILAEMIKKTEEYIKKIQISFTLSFLALSGRQQAFISKVHEQKNHQGQIKFANIIRQYIKIDNPQKYVKIQLQNRRVQDPYSMRCAPQVYGVVYDCLDNLKQHFNTLLNKFHFKNILIDNHLYPNIDLFSDTQILKGDYLLMSLNQIGSTSFLRSQRILNIYLGKNQIHKDSPKQVFQLKSFLQHTIHCVSDNKLLTIPSNIDTMNIDNYEKDVFFTVSKMYEKWNKMYNNLYKIIQLQLYTAILGLNNVYEIGDGQIFKNQIVKNQYIKLIKNISPKNKKQTLYYLQNQWVVDNYEQQQNNTDEK